MNGNAIGSLFQGMSQGFSQGFNMRMKMDARAERKQQLEERKKLAARKQMLAQYDMLLKIAKLPNAKMRKALMSGPGAMALGIDPKDPTGKALIDLMSMEDEDSGAIADTWSEMLGSALGRDIPPKAIGAMVKDDPAAAVSGFLKILLGKRKSEISAGPGYARAAESARHNRVTEATGQAAEKRLAEKQHFNYSGKPGSIVADRISREKARMAKAGGGFDIGLDEEKPDTSGMADEATGGPEPTLPRAARREVTIPMPPKGGESGLLKRVHEALSGLGL
jgi:hypothetical protein